MFDKVIQAVKDFISNVFEDISGFDYEGWFKDTGNLLILLGIIVAIIIVVCSMNIFSLIKGVFVVSIIFFVFIWRKDT